MSLNMFSSVVHVVRRVITWTNLCLYVGLPLSWLGGVVVGLRSRTSDSEVAGSSSTRTAFD